MKRNLWMPMILLLVAMIIIPATTVLAERGIVANAALLNMRSGPGAGYGVVLRLSQGQIINMNGRNADTSWIQISTLGGASGWVNSRYLSGDFSNLPVVAATGRYSAYTTSARLNIRSGPGANFEILATVGVGTGVDLIGRNADTSWAEVQVPGGVTGWASTRYLTASMMFDNLPVTSNTGQFMTFPQAVPTGGRTGIVTTRSLHVRLGPGLNYGFFDRLYQGEGVLLLGRNGQGNWLLVQLGNGTTGWVNAGFIDTEFPISELVVRA